VKISYKIFGSFLLTVLLIVFLTIITLRYSIRHGFEDYVNKVEKENLAAVLDDLQQAYAEHNSWEPFRSNPKSLRKLMRLNLLRKKNTFSSRMFNDPQRPEPEMPPGFRRDPPPPKGERIPFRPRYFLLDNNKQPVAGRSRFSEGDKLIAVSVEGKTVGWLGLKKRKPFRTPLEADFLRKQFKVFYLIGAGICLITGLVAFLLSKHLLAPVKKLADGTQALAERNFKTRIHVNTRDELGRLASDFNAMASTLEKYEQMRQQWILDISHELRTPLSILRGEIEALQDGIREVNPQTLDSLYSEARHLGKIVEDLHELSLADTHALHLRKIPVDPFSVLKDILNQFKNRFASAGITTRVDPGPDIRLPADADRLTQLYSNLLENTLRYAESPGWLKVRGERRGGHLVIFLEDSGPGVPDASVARLFDRLYRVDPARSRESGGSGLGLAICKTIVEAHGGDITAANVLNGGLEIRISFPLGAKKDG
jgi:two-component system, OmpR family, sensor histidine kinase BaeS